MAWVLGCAGAAQKFIGSPFAGCLWSKKSFKALGFPVRKAGRLCCCYVSFKKGFSACASS